MGQDYYAILEISRNANQDDVRKAYRKQALKWHPDKNRDRKTEAEARFKDIAEAYDVLGDPEKRRIYDRAGEEGLKGRSTSVPPTSSDPGHPQPPGFSYVFTSDPNDVFARFFKDSFQRSNSFKGHGFPDIERLFGSSRIRIPSPVVGGTDSFRFGRTPSSSRSPSPMRPPSPRGREHKRPAVFELACSLEELYNGVTKKMRVKRKSMSLQRDPEKVLEIDVKPGWKSGTKLTFPGEGDELGSAGVAQDVVFVICEKRHEHFTREGSNLLHHRKIPLVDALTGFSFDLPHLEAGQTLRVNVNEVVSPASTIILKGKGMPSRKGNKTVGDLVVTFDIVYPSSISDLAKVQLRELLPSS